jgi:nickel/cobalt transporter (NicO) family protein
MIFDFIHLLKSMDGNINRLLRAITVDFSLTKFSILILLSFVYGILHSLGPGHGKILVATFFTKEKHNLKKVLLLSSVIALVHSGSAILLSLALSFIFTTVKGLFRIKIQSYFIIISGIMITIVGLIFLILKIIKKDELNLDENLKSRNIFLIGVAAGIVPCPVALTIMLLSISRNILFVGLLSVISISIGMFIVLSTIGFITIQSRKGLLSFTENKFHKRDVITSILEYGTVILIIFIGLSMSFSMFIK